MELYQRLDKVLQRSAIDPHDREVWSLSIAEMPFHRQEVFVYLLEHLEPSDVIFFNENFKDKIAMLKDLDPVAMKAILAKESTYLSHE